ncbi:hypothetical protein LNP00_03555 [Fructobacillus sp. M158]|uniref:hypothetical protein n=1 Tax=Fructobacillus parabroussonetiae TaxID=2713174 RepID=UPI00200B9170|nr:hypothetical protein [Fructobacillus parabroussonetiae]MCK8617443.1 hypothetical protein [Fructobacillus parabroussonetiae]
MITYDQIDLSISAEIFTSYPTVDGRVDVPVSGYRDVVLNRSEMTAILNEAGCQVREMTLFYEEANQVYNTEQIPCNVLAQGLEKAIRFSQQHQEDVVDYDCQLIEGKTKWALYFGIQVRTGKESNSRKTLGHYECYRIPS